MVDLESHRIIDLLDSRETGKVEEWLKSYPNIQVISRDGAQTYASAAANSHPGALQISDRFHLLKNLSGAVEEYMYRLFPSRLAVPAVSQNPEMQALYDTRNRTERIPVSYTHLIYLFLLLNFVQPPVHIQRFLEHRQGFLS